MIDWTRIAELHDEIGADDFAEVVELFLEEVDAVITRLRDAPDHSTLESDLHFLKASALNLGFAHFSTLCETGEQNSAAGRADAVDLDEILTCYDASRHTFATELATRVAA